MAFIRFMASTTGRWVRGGVGVLAVFVGVLLGGWWLALTAFGALFILLGAFDLCPLAALVGKPIRGKAFLGRE